MKFRATLRKQEKIKSSEYISELLQEKKSLFSFPFKVYYRIHDQERSPAIRFGVSVPKSSYKKAVQRNRLKRVIREAYRLEKAKFLNKHEGLNNGLDLFFIYIDREAKEPSISKGIQKIFAQVDKLI